MVYTTAGGEAVLRSLPADAAIRNLPVAPRPPTIPPRALPPANWGAPVNWGGGSAIVPYGAGAAGGGAAGGAAATGGAASTALAIGAGVAAFGFGFATGDAVAQALGIEYPGGKNALQYFFGGRSPGIGATGAVDAPIPANYEGDPPFTGGQSPGVLYVMETVSTFPPPFQNTIFTITYYGPATSRRIISTGENSTRWEVDARNSSGQPTTFTSTNGVPISRAQWGTNRRVDGLPDTGGNPRGTPEPGTVDRRVGAPLAAAPTAPAPTPTPTTAPPAAPAPATPGTPVNPTEDRPSAGLPWWAGLPAMPAGSPAGGLAGSPAPGPNTTPINNPKPDSNDNRKSPPPPTRTDNSCRCNIPLFNKLDDLDKKLERSLGGAGLAADGGILAYLQRMQAFAEKAWKATQMQKVLDVLTFIGVMHNVSMLSRDIGETFFYVLGQGLDIVGIDDEEGNQLNIGAIVGTTVNNFVRGVFGDAFVDGAIDSYRKANRIVQTASMVVWTVRSLSDTSLDLMEWVGENTGKIGNALKRFGVVGERSFPWMAESAQARAKGRARFSKLTDTLENAEDRLSSYSVATSSVLELTQEVNELGENWQSFKGSLNEVPDPWFSNQPVETQVATETAASASPNIAAADAERSN